jgi:hypothetical protein
MYINNIRAALNEFNDELIKEFAAVLCEILRAQYSKTKENTKPQSIENRVRKFKDGGMIEIDFYEAILLTFDVLEINGAINALKNGHTKISLGWRQLLLRITEDRTPSEEIIIFLDDPLIIKDLKALFFNSIEYCKDNSKSKFHENLILHNAFIQLALTKR